MREVSLGRGEVLYAPGAPVDHVFFPSSAVLSAVTVMEDERGWRRRPSATRAWRVLLFGLAGGISGPRRIRSDRQLGITLSGARGCGRGRRKVLASDDAALLRHAAAGTLQAEQSVACNVLHEGPARLARWLLTTSDRTGGPVFALTQDYMAVMVGVQRSTVSLLASALKDEGLIGYTRGMVEIRDRDGLERRACECYRVIRSAYEALAGGAGRPRAPTQAG